MPGYLSAILPTVLGIPSLLWTADPMSNPRSANGHRRRKVLARLRTLNDPCWICGLPIDPSLPAGHPEAMEADEIIPVSKGGSPTDLTNIKRAHRCCNNWRRTKSAAIVSSIRRQICSRFNYSNAIEFVNLAKSRACLENKQINDSIPTSTDW